MFRRKPLTDPGRTARTPAPTPRTRLLALTRTTLALAALLPAALHAHAQTSTAEGAAAAAPFDAARAFEHVRKLVDVGPRVAGSKELGKARKYIVSELKSYGLKVTEDEFKAETPVGKRKMVNVTAELPGESPDFIILASHYDTKLFKEFRFVGANDGGSSTGVLLELARALAASKRKPQLGYRFVFFDGEEAFCREWDDCSNGGAPDNTYGSRRYAARLKEAGELKRLRALILLDMVGYRRLQFGRDTMSTGWLLDIIWRAARDLGHAAQFPERAEDVGGDDHEPFIREGVEAVDLIQLNSYPHWHTAGDTLDKIAPQSLKVVGDVVLASLPRIEERLVAERRAAESLIQLVSTEQFEGVIFPKELEKYDAGYHDYRVREFWTPTKDDILTLEQRLSAYLLESPRTRSTKIRTELPRYRRQYFGVVEGGRRKIFVNGLCEDYEHLVDWKKSYALVLDGGDCFFRVTYDTESGGFSDFSTNGYA